MDIYEQAAQSYRNDCETADREREYKKREEQQEGRTVLETMMGADFERYFEVTEARNRDHAQDSSI